MLRDTAQRRAIRRAFQEAGRPLATHELHLFARETHPSLGIATVYRTVKRLLEQGWLRQVDIPHGPTCYEIAVRHKHHYFQCDGCGKVYDTICREENMTSILPEGFILNRHEVYLYGACMDCASQPHASFMPAASLAEA